MLPILVMSDTLTMQVSQLLEDTYFNSSVFEKKLSTFESCESIITFLSGNVLLSGTKKASIVNIARGIQLFVSLISSDTLILISIRMNRNKIDTAPTYTSKYDIPINLIPMKIRQQDILENSKIKYKTETIGFLAIIVKIAAKNDIIFKISRNIDRNPLDMSDKK